MKILIISENFRTGGLETQVIGFVKHLVKAGHEIYLVSGLNSRTAPLKRLIGDENIFEVDMNPYLSTSAFSESLYKIISYAKEIDPDVIHLHPFTSLIYGGLASAYLEKPYVVTLHGPASVSSWGTAYRIFLKIILKDAFKVFCVSREVYERAKAIIEGANLVLLPNGVDTERFKPAQVDPSGPIAFISRLDSDKLPGIKAFLNLWSGLSPQERNPVHIFGDGFSLEELKAWVKDELRGESWIRFMGHRDDLDEAIKAGYSAVAGMGRVILEALAMEIPAILVGYDGVKGVVTLENVEDFAKRNFSGRYTPNVDIDELLEGMKKALRERALLRDWVKKKADEGRIVERYLEELRNLPEEKEYFWKEPLFSAILDAEDATIFGDKVLFNLVRNFSLGNELSNLINLHLIEKLPLSEAEKHRIMKEKEELLQNLNESLKQTEELRAQSEELRLQRDYYINKLNEIYTSNFWKVARTCYKIIYNTPLKYVYKLIRPNRFLNSNQNEKFNPYENLKILKPIEVKVVDERFEIKDRGLKFSVITPVRNEGKSIYTFLCKIKDQTLKPEEVIVVENFSTDNTLSEIQRFIKDYGKEVNIKLIVSKEKGLARDRNIGIKESTNEILILLDAGVEFGNDLFEILLATLSEFPSADLIAGIYEPTVENIWAKSFVWDWKSIDYSNYIPSSKCLLVKKSKVLSVGGYPEFLPYTGEDTLFAIRYRKISNLWIINKRIKVLWHAPTNKKEAVKKAFLYGWGDGLIGLGEFKYYKELSKWLKSGNLKKWWIKSRFIRHTVIREHFKGFLKGRKERNEYLRNDINGVWLILSLVPFTDSGGGQRGTQLSLELMKNKNKVVFCNVYPSFEEKKEVYLDIEPELLELYQIKDFNIKDFWERHKMFSERLVILLEAPHPEFIPIVNQVKSLNPQTKVIYDCIDNWDSSLGWIWYKKEIEDEVISLVDFITVSAETLRERMQSLTSKPIYLIPNAVNTRVFKKDGCYITPKDLPTDKPIAIYVGAMWGEWFDWDLLYEMAKEFNINFVLIGNCPQERLSELKKDENIYYLGLKPQFELPAYLSQAKIALIPFKYDDKIIKYTNPLKVYEYLAMGLPVVATYMDELVSLPYVFLSKTYKEFKDNMKSALELVVDYDRLKDFVENNSWTARVRKLLEIVKG